ncbi:NPC1-like intracellular cholesterol transporter 1 isoform X2 [Rana temporaria]|uniref:NPC1-like intracellular cholesterol transporter 1 isoform X2 n=1 Tax=Rana temporaria TaxID=8407 RepID=UPI001AAC8339|nr:NPC1-like intracellular cholesterol transporter 1 isoform X2 [Rana temporaria]
MLILQLLSVMCHCSVYCLAACCSYVTIIAQFTKSAVLFLYIFLLQVVAYTTTKQEGYCTIYDECGLNPEVSNSLIPAIIPCLANRKASKLNGTNLRLLKEICPMLYTGDDNTYACCSSKQLQSIQKSFALSKVILSRCPSCAENFANIYCQNTCSPNQSLFINVTRVNDTIVDGKPELGVLAYQCYFRRSFAEQSFDSCKNVRLPSTGGYAISAMCGKYGAEFCTAQRWLDFQGDISNGLAPLQIDFRLIENDTEVGGGVEPHESRVWSCSEGPGNDPENACTCQDCKEACPKISEPEPLPEPFKIGSIDGYLIISSVIFIILILFFIMFLIMNCSINRCGKKKRKEIPHIKYSDLNCSEKVSLKTNHSMEKAFQWWGTIIASYPKTVIGVSVILVGVLSAGMALIKLTTDPVELWSSPNSRARQEKDFHDKHFGPFFRTNQIIITVNDRSLYVYDSLFFGALNFSRILSPDILLEMMDLQTKLQNIAVWSEKHQKNVTLKDVCFAPLNPSNPSETDCCVNSLMQYFQNNRTRFNLEVTQTLSGETKKVGWRDHFMYCVNSPLSFKDVTDLELSCMADYGAPVFPFLAVGGYEDTQYSESQGLILTISLNNYARSDPRFDYVLLWEKEFLNILKEYQKDPKSNLTIAFMAERSLEDEISRTTTEDIPIFAISYLVIFIYITLALGEYSSCRRVLVDSKVTLGLGGILVVLGAVFSSMGFYCYLGIPSSLIIVEVVPFLVLAVGADNIFIFVLELQRDERKEGERREEQIGRVLGNVAPSMLLCSLSEALCFFLGALTQMPAVRTFALNAALAILLDFLLQISMFVALVSMDMKRQESSRFDICCCIKSKSEKPTKKSEGWLVWFMEKVYCPILLNPFSRVVVMVAFIFLFCCGTYFMMYSRVGLNQELSVPLDSYMIDYFEALNEYFEVGVPTYFVTTPGYNFSNVDGMNGICSSAGCDNNSMTQKIQYATDYPTRSYLAIPASSWVDDFVDWLNPSSDCCRLLLNGTFCSSTSPLPGCIRRCMRSTNGTLRPTLEEFNHYLPIFLQDYPNLKCPKGGLGSYDNAVKFNDQGEIIASRFMAYHTPLKNSQEYTGGLLYARELAADITKSLRNVNGTHPDFQVFPYTITYVFYEQYLTIVQEGLFTLALCLLPTFAVCCILLGMDLRSGLINLLTIFMIIIDTVGVMTLWGIDYNAISLINLVTAIGISVEFVSHLTRSFALSSKLTKVERAKDATIYMGSAVLAGVAMTNLPGIIVLAFAKAQLIQIFFFRLNLTITLLGLVHGLIFLPVALSYFGPNVSRAVLLLEQQKKEQEKRLENGVNVYTNPDFQGDEKNTIVYTNPDFHGDEKNTIVYTNPDFHGDEKNTNNYSNFNSQEDEKNKKA